MTTIVNSPGGSEGMGVGFIVGIMVAIAALALFVVFGVPALRGEAPKDNSIDVNVKLPSGNVAPAGAPQQ